MRKQSIKQKAAQLVAMFIFSIQFVRCFFEMTACRGQVVRIRVLNRDYSERKKFLKKLAYLEKV